MKSPKAEKRAGRQRGSMSDLGMLSDAIMQAGEQRRKAQTEANKIVIVKQCPCHKRQCEEQALGGRACPPGVCVRMN